VFETELAYFIANQDDLVARHRGSVLVIRGDQVVGVFKSPLDAYLTARERFAPGSFMVQPCEPGSGAYTVTVTSVSTG
jgi:hypothetical protein